MGIVSLYNFSLGGKKLLSVYAMTPSGRSRVNHCAQKWSFTNQRLRSFCLDYQMFHFLTVRPNAQKLLIESHQKTENFFLNYSYFLHHSIPS